MPHDASISARMPVTLDQTVAQLRDLLSTARRSEAAACLCAAVVAGHALRRTHDLEALLGAYGPVGEEPEAMLAEGVVWLAQDRLVEATQRLLEARDQASSKATRFQAHAYYMNALALRDEWGAFRAAIPEGLALEAAGERADRARFRLFLGISSHAFGQGLAAEASLRASLEFPVGSDPRLIAAQQVGLVQLAGQAFAAGALGAAVLFGRRAVARLQQEPERPGLLRVAIARLDEARGDLGLPPVLRAELQQRDPWLQLTYLRALGLHHLREGRVAEASAVLAHARPLGAGAASGLALLEATLLRSQGQFAAAHTLLDAALAPLREQPELLRRAQLEAALILLLARRADEGLPLVDEALADLELRPAAHLKARALALRSVLLEAVGQGREALVALRGALRLEAETGYAGVFTDLEPAAEALRARLGAPEPVGPQVIIQAFGGLAVQVGGELVTSWPRRKTRQLLAMLLVARGGLDRQALADQLFPELEVAGALHQLDNLTSTLRKLLEPELAPRRESRYLKLVDGRFWLDAAAMELDLHQHQLAHDAALAAWARQEGEAAMAATGRAIAPVCGPVLGDPELEGDFAAVAACYRARVLELLGRALDHTLATGAAAAAPQWLEPLRALAPEHPGLPGLDAWLAAPTGSAPRLIEDPEA